MSKHLTASDIDDRILERSGRYLMVKDLLDDKQYSDSVLRQYVYLDNPSEDFAPRSYLHRYLFGVFLSILLLAAAIWIGITFRAELGLDPLGGWLLAGIWGGITLLVAMSIPKGYRTRKLLASLDSK